MSTMIRRLIALGAVLASFAGFAAPASALGSGEPLFTFIPGGASVPAPTGYLVGPCGLGVDSAGNFYVSDYYHHAIDVYNGSADYTAAGVTGATGYITQIADEDPLDGPCGLALDSTDRLYVNNFDRGVLRFSASPAFGAGTAIAGAGVDSTHPSAVAVDPTTNDVYVNDRTYITGYDSSGLQLTDAPGPLKIGEGTLGEGYGLAIDSGARLYVADATDNTVKVYDPAALDKSTPVATIAGPPGGFTSLRHAALAVDRSSDVLYVVDNLQPRYAEQPAAQVDVYDPSLSPPDDWGVLKYQIVDALPAGLAVDNSAGANQGRVYVTSGNTDQAGIYAYAAGSQIGSSQPPTVGLLISALGSGAGTVTASLGGIYCTSACSAQIRSGAPVALTATPDPGSTFTGWSGGGCEGVGGCTVRMDQLTSVAAEFEAAPGAGPPAGALNRAQISPPPSAPTATSPARPLRAKRSRHRRHRPGPPHHRRVRHHHT
jgi:DNA-binding beta-propeller fold protein YncE